MYKLDTAISKARSLSHKNNRDYYVVYSIDEEDRPGNNYHVASEIDLDSWFAGCDVLFATEDMLY